MNELDMRFQASAETLWWEIRHTPIDLPALVEQARVKDVEPTIHRQLAVFANLPEACKVRDLEARRAEAVRQMDTSRTRIDEIKAKCTNGDVADSAGIESAVDEIGRCERVIGLQQLTVESLDAGLPDARARRDVEVGRHLREFADGVQDTCKKELATLWADLWAKCNKLMVKCIVTDLRKATAERLARALLGSNYSDLKPEAGGQLEDMAREAGIKLESQATCPEAAESKQ